MVQAAAPVKDALAAAVAALEAAGVDTPRLDAELLVADALHATRAELYADPDRALDASEAARLSELVGRRARREPVAYILGRASFRELDLLVDHRVLTPRPETELLVDLAQGRRRVLDVGTGSGAIALAIASEREGASVTGIDISPDAIELARENARRNALDVEFLIAEVMVGGPYDLVVSNPPYVREGDWDSLQPEISLYEPRDAVVGGPDGLDVVRALVPSAAEALVRGGLLGIEVGQGQSRTVESLFERAGFASVETTRDLAGIPRVVTGRKR